MASFDHVLLERCTVDRT